MTPSSLSTSCAFVAELDGFAEPALGDGPGRVVDSTVDGARFKLLRLVARDITTTRGGVAGTGAWNWRQAPNILEMHFPGRLHVAG
jgi:hypothetical protein